MVQYQDKNIKNNQNVSLNTIGSRDSEWYGLGINCFFIYLGTCRAQSVAHITAMLHSRIQHNDYLKETVFPVLYALCPAQNSPFQAGSSSKLEVNPRKKKKKGSDWRLQDPSYQCKLIPQFVQLRIKLLITWNIKIHRTIASKFILESIFKRHFSYKNYISRVNAKEITGYHRWSHIKAKQCQYFLK